MWAKLDSNLIQNWLAMHLETSHKNFNWKNSICTATSICSLNQIHIWVEKKRWKHLITSLIPSRNRILIHFRRTIYLLMKLGRNDSNNYNDSPTCPRLLYTLHGSAALINSSNIYDARRRSKKIDDDHLHILRNFGRRKRAPRSRITKRLNGIIIFPRALTMLGCKRVWRWKAVGRGGTPAPPFLRINCIRFNV